MSRRAERRAYEACGETCPDVRAALEVAFEEIKKSGTEKLREALIEAYELVETAEAERDEAESQRKELERELADTRAELADTRAALREEEAA